MAWFELAGRAADGTEISLGVDADSAEDAMSSHPEIQEVFWITRVSDDGLVRIDPGPHTPPPHPDDHLDDDDFEDFFGF